MPATVARALADAVGSRAREGLQLEQELLAYADAEDARPKRMQGFLRREDEGNYRR